MDKLILAFCRLGFAGLSPIMPGTCGSALAAVLAPFLFIPLPFVARIVVLVLVFWIGGMAATRGEQILGYKDPGEIVIDELLGMWPVSYTHLCRPEKLEAIRACGEAGIGVVLVATVAAGVNADRLWPLVEMLSLIHI